MILRMLCSMEAYHAPLLWTTKSIVADVSIYTYSFILIIDFFLYYLIAIFLGLHQHRLKEKISLYQTNIPKSSSWGKFFNENTLKNEHKNKNNNNNNLKNFQSTNWINLTKIGIPYLLGRSKTNYSQIPDINFEVFSNISQNISSSVALFISSLCKSYETIEGNSVEVLKNLNGELKKGTITTLLGR